MKKVYGSYENPRQAREAVDNLLKENYTKDQIRVISSPNFIAENDQSDNYTQSKERYEYSEKNPKSNYTENDQRDDYTEDDRTLWEKIKDAFTFHEYHEDYFAGENVGIEERTLLEPYIEHLKRGETIVMVDENPDNQIGTQLNTDQVGAGLHGNEVGTELNTDQVGSALHNRQDSIGVYEKNTKDHLKK